MDMKNKILTIDEVDDYVSSLPKKGKIKILDKYYELQISLNDLEIEEYKRYKPFIKKYLEKYNDDEFIQAVLNTGFNVLDFETKLIKKVYDLLVIKKLEE
jgi:hypothetical protein